MASPPLSAALASTTPIATDPISLDGDLPVSVREWRRAVRGYRRRSNLFTLLATWLPLVVFLGTALALFYRLTTRLEAVFALELRQRLPWQTPSWTDGPSVDRLLVAFDLSDEVARAHWWSLTLVSLALLLVAASLLAFFALLSRLPLVANPRTRADLRVNQQLTKASFRTILPALWTAAFLYITWMVWTALANLSHKAPDLDADRLVDSFTLLVAILLGLAVCGSAALVAASLQRREVPREHLLRWLGRSFSSLLVASLMFPTIFFAIYLVFPRWVVPAVDRMVLARLDARVLHIVRRHDLVSPEEIRRIVRDLPTRVPLEKAPMVQGILDEVPLRRFLHAVTVLWLAAATFQQAFVAWLARGVSRWVWLTASAVGAMLLLAIHAGWAEPVFGGTAGIVSITAYVVLACAAVSADIFLNPASSPRRAAADDPEELALARVRLQEGRSAGAEATASARRVYERVGCALNGCARGEDG